MSDEATTDETIDATAEATADEATAGVAVAEAEAPAAAVDEAPQAEAEGPQAGEADVDEPAADEAPQAEAESLSAFGPVRVARVFVCERGHRTTTLWGTPDVCQARPLRNSGVCAMPLYHITELPEQVQKKLNPLKASKKASKKK